MRGGERRGEERRRGGEEERRREGRGWYVAPASHSTACDSMRH